MHVWIRSLIGSWQNEFTSVIRLFKCLTIPCTWVRGSFVILWIINNLIISDFDWQLFIKMCHDFEAIYVVANQNYISSSTTIAISFDSLWIIDKKPLIQLEYKYKRYGEKLWIDSIGSFQIFSCLYNINY